MLRLAVAVRADGGPVFFRQTRVGRDGREFRVLKLRPPLPSEVAGYERAAQRRLLVKPGITGLWHVSGRSDLSWKQCVRLDLRYVENWTLALDALILVKTIRAVVRGGGAY
jgi:lipopolysaccharide/colanic/teichoic acid biosynthesis glycosyltransferase